MSVISGMLRAVDYRHVERRFRRFQFHAELLLQRSEEGWRVRIGWRQRLAWSVRANPAFLREGHDELPRARQARAIDNRASRLADKHTGGLRHREAVEGNLPDAAHD